MTNGEKQKAIDALKISAPLMAVTQEEFNDYIQTLNKIMDWLEQEPTTKNNLGVDCISRQFMYELGATCIAYRNDKQELIPIIAIDLLPSVTPQPRWISVSERLPEPNANDGLIARYYLIQNEYEDMLVARYDGTGWKQMYQHEYLEDDVIAWMPLPKAYREVEDG